MAGAVVWGLIGGAGALSIAATILGHRGATGRRAPGVRPVKTAVPLLLLGALVVSVVTAAIPDPMGLLRGGGLWPVPVLFMLGMAATALADWFLAPIDNEKTFGAGLASFLVGYLLYGVALLQRAAGLVTHTRGVVIAGAVYVVVALLGVVQYRRLRNIPTHLQSAVIAYLLVVSNLLAAGVTHTIAALSTTTARHTAVAMPNALMRLPILLILLGTVSIYVSDSLIAHNLFRSRLKSEELWIMPTYYGGQVVLTVAFVLLGSAA